MEDQKIIKVIKIFLNLTVWKYWESQKFIPFKSQTLYNSTLNIHVKTGPRTTSFFKDHYTSASWYTQISSEFIPSFLKYLPMLQHIYFPVQKNIKEKGSFKVQLTINMSSVNMRGIIIKYCIWCFYFKFITKKGSVPLHS